MTIAPESAGRFEDLSVEQTWEAIADTLHEASYNVGSVTGHEVADVLKTHASALADYDFNDVQQSTIDSSMDTVDKVASHPYLYAKVLGAVGLSVATAFAVAVSGLMSSTAPAVQPSYDKAVSVSVLEHSPSGYTEGFSAVSQNYAGADGTFSVNLPDGRVLWVMADTLRPSDSMIHSSVVVQSEGQLSFLPEQFLPTPDEGFYWPSGAFLQKKSDGYVLVVNAQHVNVPSGSHDTLGSLNAAAGFDFVRQGSTQFVYSVDLNASDLNLTLLSSQDLSKKLLVGAMFEGPSGVFMLATDESKDATVIGSDMFLVKAPAADAPVEQWSYWSPNGFTKDVKDASALLKADGFLAADSTPSVYKAKDGYVVVSKNKGALGSEVVGMLFDEGFNLTDVKVLASAKSSDTDFTYNAQVHVLPSKDGSPRVVLSVDNNTTGVAASATATSYRPSFYRAAVPTKGKFSPSL